MPECSKPKCARRKNKCIRPSTYNAFRTANKGKYTREGLATAYRKWKPTQKSCKKDAKQCSKLCKMLKRSNRKTDITSTKK